MSYNKFLKYTIIWTLLILFSVNESSCTKKSDLDDYVMTVQNECYSSKKIISCVKYRVARYVWSFASGRINLFEFDTENNDFGNGIRLVQLTKPNKMELFTDARQLSTDNEIGKAFKFLKRSITTFIDHHGVRIGVGTENEPRVLESNIADNLTTDSSEGRIKKNKRKWNLIFPLAILIKLLHLKLILVPIVLGVGLLQLILIVGGALLFTYLRNNTLCKIQPHLIHSTSHVTSESDIGGGFSGGGYGGGFYGGPPSYLSNPHGGYNKDWSTNRAYSAYSFLDTTKRPPQKTATKRYTAVSGAVGKVF